MKILFLNAGSSTLKCTLMESEDSAVFASGLADWAGTETRYHYAGPDGKKQSDRVSWSGHAEARRVLHDLRLVEPIALPDRSTKQKIAPQTATGTDGLAKLREQYGCCPVQLSGTEEPGRARNPAVSKGKSRMRPEQQDT